MSGIDLKASWSALWDRLGARGDAGCVYDDLTRRYSESWRAYHTLAHIEHCLKELASAPVRPADCDAIEFALWFHDAIYDPKGKDNEERSLRGKSCSQRG